MKKLCGFILLLMAHISCVSQEHLSDKGEQDTINPSARTFTAVCEGVQTKTGLDGELNVLFSSGDAISVFDHTGRNFKFVTDESGTSVTFHQATEGELSGNQFYAVYPYNESTTIEDNVICTKMNTAAYKASPGTLSKPYHNIMTANTSSDVLEFRNLASLIKFTVPQDLKVSAFYFALANSLAKDVSVSIDEAGIPEVVSRSEECWGINMNSKDGLLMAPGVYYMPVLSGVYKNFRMMMTHTTEGAELSDAFSFGELHAERNEVINIGTLYDNRDYYKWLNFEGGSYPSSIFTYVEGALEVVDNPYNSTGNATSKVLKNTANTQWNKVNGGFDIDMGFLHDTARSRIKSFKYRVHFGGNMYFPRLQSGSVKSLPDRINGKTPSSGEWTKEELKSVIAFDGWNVMEHKVDLSSSTVIKLRPMLFTTGENIDKSTGNRTIWLDDMGFSFEEDQPESEYDVFLLLGQSNMAGRGTMIEGDTDPIHENVYLLDDAGAAELATNPLNKYSTIRKSLDMQQIGPGFSFSKKVAERTGRKILLVVNARGGSHIDEWLVDSDMGYYTEALNRAKLALAAGGRLRGILWHQGESNPRNSNYLDQLLPIVTGLRRELNAPNVPFVAGEIAYWRESSQYFNPIISKISDVIPNSDFVSAEGCTMLIDLEDPHFSRDGQILLGERYAEKILKMCYGL